MIKSLREALFGLGGTTVTDLQNQHNSIQDRISSLKESMEQASAARHAAIGEIVAELAEIANVAKNYA